jgi:hypothetical protein
MNPCCLECLKEMKIATFGRHCFVCEPCREFRQLLRVGNLEKQLPWKAFCRKGESIGELANERNAKRSATVVPR